MNDTGLSASTLFRFGDRMKVEILQGNILAPGVTVEAVVSTDDNYLTMGSGVSALLRKGAGSIDYVREAQAQCPVKVGTVVPTGAYQLPEHGLDVRRVLHAAVIDYDTSGSPLDQIVHQATANCLAKAEELELSSILFPAFATGSGGLTVETCARRMCTAIKTYVAQERPVKTIYLILYLPQEGKAEPAEIAQQAASNQRFIREANLVLGTPYNPDVNQRQVWGFFRREAEIQRLQEIITGAQAGKRHVVIVGGPRIGKTALLDQLFHRAQIPGNSLGQGRCLARVTFGQVHQKTPAPFIYRMLLWALKEVESDVQTIEELRESCGNPELNGALFMNFLKDHSGQYPEVIFLVDDLPRLLRMGAQDFWDDLDSLGGQARFVFTATDDNQYQTLLGRLSDGFKAELEEVRLKCISSEERKAWVNELYQRYVGRDASEAEHAFFADEAGCHPYLISVVGYALIDDLIRDALTSPTPVKVFNRSTLRHFFQRARYDLEKPRQVFFDRTLQDDSLSEIDRIDLKNLARAVAAEGEWRRLLPGLDRGDTDAVERLRVLQKQDNSRLLLHEDALHRLEDRGCLIGADDRKTARFMAQSFADWLQGQFGTGEQRDDQPSDVVVGFLNPQPDLVTTLFGKHGGNLVSAQRRLPVEIREKFMDSFRSCINHALYPTRFPQPGAFKDLEGVANFLLTYFTTDAIKDYLEVRPKEATIQLTVDDALKDIPWELLLETAYGDDFPFNVGRSMVCQQSPHNIRPPVRGHDRIKALLIGNPTGDLADAEIEITNLRDQLRSTQHFEIEDEDVLIGSDKCQWLAVLNALSTGKYGLIHYSGHSEFDGYQSAWYLKEGKITTDLLTSALQNAPPVLVFSSSCESAVGAEVQPARYENQTFDLPSAFLRAGVEVYVGTLWKVGSSAARSFVEEFYSAFLSVGHPLGKCMRLAKTAIRGNETRLDRLSFILYGDPHLTPGELFPALKSSQ